MARLSFTLCALLLGAVSLAPHAAPAQAFPIKPVRLVAPFPPGSGADVIGRIYAPKLVETLGQPFVMDNRPGASGNIAAKVVAQANPDGYTLLILAASIASSQSLYKDLGFDLAKDFAPVGMLGVAAYVLVVNNALPAKSVKELISLARSRPGLTYASTGQGGALHLTMEMLQLQAGTKMLHVPYKGSTTTVPDLMGGRVDTMFGSTLSLFPHVRAGRIRALGITTSKRSPAMPELPTIAETLPGFESASWFAFMAPARTPRPTRMQLNSALVKAAQTRDIVNALAHQSTEPSIMTPEETGAFVVNEIVKWAKVIRVAGVQPE